MSNEKIGIDKIGLYLPPYYIDMVDLAHERGEEPDKYTIGLGQEKMAIPPESQDMVSMAANAALQIIDDDDREKIDLVVLATETGIDKSKAGSVYVHHLTGIQPFARSIEMKQACYSGTAGLQLAISHIANHPGSRALVVASDIAKYGLNSGGETTQGAGAVAMLVKEDPRIAIVDPESVSMSRDIMDFWKPNYLEYPEVKGQYSSMQYLDVLSKVWEEYQKRHHVTVDDFESFIFHLPFTKLGEKGLRKVMKGASDEKKADLKKHYEHTRLFSKNVGNIYTGSLFLGFLSSLVNDSHLSAGDRIGAFSYGSGAVGEFFSMELVEGYREALDLEAIQSLFDNRQKLSIQEYEDSYDKELPTDGSEYETDHSADNSAIILAGIKDHERQYRVY